VDAAGRIPLVLLLFFVLLFGKKITSFSFGRLHFVYLLFVSYVFINGLLHGSHMNYEGNGIYIMFVNLFCPYFYLLIVCCLAYYDIDRTLKWVTWSLLAFCTFCLVFGDITDEGRLGGDLNANGMATYAVFCFYCLLLQFMRNRRGFISFVAFSIIPIFLIVITGSRTAFVLLVFVSLLSVLLFYKKRNAGSVVITIVVAVVLVVGFMYVMNNTILGERLQSSTTQMEDSMNQTGTILDKIGDRGPQYYWSWPYFLDHPVFGIGLNNWRKVSGSPYVFHSEWLVQYCENGIIALFLYLLFYFSLINKTRQLSKSSKRKNNSNYKSNRLMLYILLSVFLLNFVGWTYNCYCVFAFYAFGIASIQRQKEILIE
jgi:hypothetical protein